MRRVPMVVGMSTVLGWAALAAMACERGPRPVRVEGSPSSSEASSASAPAAAAPSRSEVARDAEDRSGCVPTPTGMERSRCAGHDVVFISGDPVPSVSGNDAELAVLDLVTWRVCPSEIIGRVAEPMSPTSVDVSIDDWVNRPDHRRIRIDATTLAGCVHYGLGRDPSTQYIEARHFEQDETHERFVFGGPPGHPDCRLIATRERFPDESRESTLEIAGCSALGIEDGVLEGFRPAGDLRWIRGTTTILAGRFHDDGGLGLWRIDLRTRRMRLVAENYIQVGAICAGRCY